MTSNRGSTSPSVRDRDSLVPDASYAVSHRGTLYAIVNGSMARSILATSTDPTGLRFTRV